MNTGRTGSALLRLMEIIADLCIVSAYWLVCCVPIVTIGASTAALYCSVIKAIRRDRGTLTSTFFSEFRCCIRRAIPISLIFAGCCGLLLVYSILGASIPPESGIFMAYWAVVIILTAIFAGTFIYVFPLMARFQQGTRVIIRTGFYMSVGYPVRTLGLICLIALFAAAVWKAPLTILFLPGAYTLLTSVILEPILNKHTYKEKER